MKKELYEKSKKEFESSKKNGRSGYGLGLKILG